MVEFYGGIVFGVVVLARTFDVIGLNITVDNELFLNKQFISLVTPVEGGGILF